MNMKEQLSAVMERSRSYTLQVAAAMPDAGYSFRPTGAAWTFGELLQHVAYGIGWWEDNYIKGKKTDWAPSVEKTDKASVQMALMQAFGGLRESMARIMLTNEVVAGLHATLDHITHHRGQAVLYLRCNGVEPPEYTY
jgi:uncharacterized damage-inducible protein DinB